MANEWPDLSMYGMRLMLSLAQGGKKTAVLMTEDGSFDPKLAQELENKGFERKSYDGQLVYAIGSLPPSLMTDNFPKLKWEQLRSKAEISAKVLKGNLTPYVEPAPVAAEEAPVADELDAIDTKVFEDIDAAPAPAKAATATAPASKAPKPAAKKPRAKKEPVAAAEKPSAPAKAEAAGTPLPGWDLLDIDLFDQFLVHEGVSPDARADYRAAIAAMSRHFSFSEIFEAEHEIDPETPNKGYGSVLRERMKAETKHKDLAKSRIIDCLYGFAKEFLNRSKAARAAHAAFSKEQAGEVEKLWEWTEGFMFEFDKKHGGIPNFLTTYPRVVRIAGMRTLFDLVTAEDPRGFEATLKDEDKRFAQDAMPGKQFANYMNPVISKLRRDPEAVVKLRAQRDAVFGEPDLDTAPAPAT